jgi:hypothetical protein
MKQCMDLGFIYIRMEVDMKETGLEMCKKEWVKKYGLMGVNMLENIKMA